MPICRHCGGLNAADATQCEKCGATVAPAAESENTAVPPSTDLSPHDAELVALLRAGRTIEAVKLHRQATGIGLKEAKDYVQDLGSRQGIPWSKGCGATALALTGLLVGSAALIMAFWLA